MTQVVLKPNQKAISNIQDKSAKNEGKGLFFFFFNLFSLFLAADFGTCNLQAVMETSCTCKFPWQKWQSLNSEYSSGTRLIYAENKFSSKTSKKKILLDIVIAKRALFQWIQRQLPNNMSYWLKCACLEKIVSSLVRVHHCAYLHFDQDTLISSPQIMDTILIRILIWYFRVN